MPSLLKSFLAPGWSASEGELPGVLGRQQAVLDQRQGVRWILQNLRNVLTFIKNHI